MTRRIPTTLILLTALCGAVSVAVAALPVVSRYAAADQVWTAATTPIQAQEHPRLDLTPILDFAPFGRSATAQATSAAPSTLTLQGVSVSADPKASRAIIAGGTSDSSSYSVGDQVAEGITLTQIASDHVALTSDKGPQRLDFPGLSAPIAEAATYSTKLQNLIPVASPSALTQPASSTLKTLRDQLKLNPQALLVQYAITATGDGYEIGDDGFVDFGLQQGDLITQINGQKVGNIATDRAFLDEVAASGQATVIAQRAGQAITLQVILP